MSVTEAKKDNLTTVLGLALGTANYASGVGAQIPQNQDEWVQFIITILIYAGGLLLRR